MNPNRFRTSLLAACAALTIVGSMAYAGDSTDAKEMGQRQGHMHRHGGASLMGTLKQLDLTDAQKQSVQSIFAGGKEQRRALRSQQRSNRAALATTMPDDAKYPALVAVQKQLAADAIQQLSDTQTQLYAVLTAEQKARIPQLLAERKARWEQRREKIRDRNKRDSAGATS
ncbi:Spy/CpxP family protein refolding chaperone [Povalibacter sp.]|uniref:Spy/CpxP family protein refolding chaperone n=1 Tax=Povalibacter sp. TaxID=1962978 RepID=UPI002F3FCD12